MSTEDLVTNFEKISTPFYYYNLDLLQETLKQAVAAAGRYGYHIHYALKANADGRLLRLVREAGLGADCVSGNEVQTAVNARFPPADIFFAGVGKTDREIRLALSHHIGCFNVESVQELQVIEQLASELGTVAPVAIRINPEVDGHTHRYITTGTDLNKFGILRQDLEPVFNILQHSSSLHFKGIHVHIGSQITDMGVYRILCEKVNELQSLFYSRGLNVRILNMGGGLGVDYIAPEEHPVPDFGRFFKLIHEHLDVMPGQEVHFELGRSLVAQMGDLITRVIYVKNSGSRTFIIVDAGMTDLIRPALYDANHHIENLTYRKNKTNESPVVVDIAGPICETADTFARNIRFPVSKRGDVLAIRSAGAYSRVMASEYNLREKAGIVYSDEILPETINLQPANHEMGHSILHPT